MGKITKQSTPDDIVLFLANTLTEKHNNEDAHYRAFSDGDMLEFIQEHWVQPFLELGLTLESYGHVDLKDSGVHCLQFDIPSPVEDGVKVFEVDFDKIHQLATRDDDSQPEANYRLYFGTLHIFVPYFQ